MREMCALCLWKRIFGGIVYKVLRLTIGAQRVYVDARIHTS